MLPLMPAPSNTNNKYLRPVRRSFTGKVVEPNDAWIARQLTDPAMGAAVSPKKRTDPKAKHPTYLLLLGGSDQVAFRLRVAQSHLRHDMWPSHWSHAALLGPAQTAGDPISRRRVFEISLQPKNPFEFAVLRNGMQETTINRYRSAAHYPNIALLRLDIEMSTWAEKQETSRNDDDDDIDELPSVFESFQAQRAILDGPEAIVMWLAFVWGVGKTANPLFDGVGIPSAAMIECILNGVGFDISPGVDSRTSAPEVFWQSAKWWHTYYRTNRLPPIIGRYDVRSRLNDHLLTLANRRHDKTHPVAST